MKVRIIKDCKWSVNFKAVDFKEGQIIEKLPSEVVDRMTELGFAVIIIDNPEKFVFDENVNVDSKEEENEEKTEDENTEETVEEEKIEEEKGEEKMQNEPENKMQEEPQNKTLDYTNKNKRGRKSKNR